MNRNWVRHIIILLTLALLTMAGTVVGQNDTPFVIKKGDNYLAHVKVEGNYVLQATSTFDPATCLWYSGPTYNPTGYTHNYYFEDDAHKLRFLAAPLQPSATLSLSSSLPSVSMLRNTDQVYYFYNWDPETELNGVPEGGGVAKGHRYYVETEEECHACGTPPAGASWYEPQSGGTPQCWEVYWIENEGSNWKLSSASSYNATAYAARYRKVTITEHEKEVTAGGLTTLTVPLEMNYGGSSTLSATLGTTYSYIPAYTQYVFIESGSESVHNCWGGSDHTTNTPGGGSNVSIGNASYEWTIAGDGQEFLSFNSSEDVDTINDATPTLYYREENQTGDKTATITVSVTYTDASNVQTTQTRSATVLVKTPCQNPEKAADPVVTNMGVIVSWYPTAESYTVSWKKESDSNWNSTEVGNVTSYTLMGLDYNTDYDYKVTTDCDNTAPTVYDFHTLPESGLMIGGAIFGGGRMANVGGKTEVVIVNCDSIGAIYGGNDIAGSILDTIEANHTAGFASSNITLGVNAGDAYASYGTTPNDGKIRVTSVYGGGNGYYAYNGTSFVPATQYYTSETIAVGASVNAMTQAHTVGDVVWTNNGSAAKTLDFPSIVNTAITVTDDKVKVDSIFGGAKNAFLTGNSGDGSLITINGGTIMAVFGGNNFGGKQGYGKHHIVVNGTTTCLTTNQSGQLEAGTLGHEFGRDFGIGYLFGGGNKVYGSTTDIQIFGGQIDNVFGGGNSADVYAANVTVNCSLGAYSSQHPFTYGNTYTCAIPTTYSSGAISIDEHYPWNGKGIYNVRNLYGGNNMESMASVPTVTLTSGGVGTVYGGGNAGDMLASKEGSIDEDDDPTTAAVSFNYGTQVILNSDDIIVDYLYGGCRMSNVDFSTWVQIRDGHVGTVFGGCNVSGDVGSTRVNPSAASDVAAYQEVQGGTYVEAFGGTVYKNLFAGGNGFYHCNQLFHYVSGINYTDENYVGKLVPTHNETYANVRTGATIKGNVYAGGNLAPVGFQDQVASYFPSFPTNAMGWAVVHVYGGTVEGNVFGGGNMADVYGSNDVLVAGGTITAVYGGNDRTGQVAEYSNRILPANYSHATDGYTSLISPEVHAYVRVVGNPTIQEVYGGGNGDYDYEQGDEVVHEYCNDNEQGPIQSNTFVDININGGADGGHIGTVYGGGDGVTASGFITVFMNIIEPNPAEDHVNVNTVFGGNNKGNLEIVPNIILLHGQVGTVYGGCNQGAMIADELGQDENGNAVSHLVTVGGYENIGSYVRLLASYDPDGSGEAPAVTPTIKVSDAVYGGCRMNGVTRNSLVLVEGGDFSNAKLFGGSDISGDVLGDSRVAVVGGTVGNIYGGGNGNYTYNPNGNVYTIPTSGDPVLVATGITTAPICATSGADILGGSVGTAALLNDGTVAQVFGAGYGKDTETTGNVLVNVGSKVPTLSNNTPILPNIYGDIYGGSAFGNVNTDYASSTETLSTTVNLFNGIFHAKTVQVNGFDVHYGGNVYGGGLGRKADQANNITAIEAKEYGEVHVNVSSADQDPDDCYLNLREANIFGCNNANGSPQDDVRVDVWRTADTIGDYDSQAGSLYAIRQVFGGGNQANYAPENQATNSDKRTWVYVHNCRNTINRVFSGGNAADATGVKATIEGGRFDYVFGGGNGEVSAANIGNGGTDLTLSAGLVNYLFGGSNSQGDITGPVNTVINGENMGSACGEHINEFFGGSNAADLHTDIHTVIECRSGLMGTLYGGCNMADIIGNVTLDVRGGTFTEVYGGSKGVAGSSDDDKADITGNVTLNLEGGTIENAFGGSNINGNITGNITVNVIDFGGDCGLDLTNVYGSGNLTPYAPTSPLSTSPVVNVIHTALTDDNGVPVGIRGNVYGGGYGPSATVTANPKVNIGYNEATMSGYLPAAEDLPTGVSLNPSNFNALVSGSVFGGGDAAPVAGNTEVNVYSGEIVQKLVGGGNAADIMHDAENTGNVTINISGGSLCTDTNIDNVGIYGGCNTTGTVGGSVELNITGTAVIGKQAIVETAKKPVNVHGGGYGQGTAVAGNVVVNYGDITAAGSLFPKLFGNLYGGSALGSVNTVGTDNTIVNVLNGSIVSITETVNAGQPNAITYYYSGNIFGGGLGQKAQGDTIAAVVNGTVHVNIGDATTPPSTGLRGKATLIGCNIYGCNNQYGSPQDNVYVDVYQTAHVNGTNTVDDNDYAILRVFGGGNEANYAPLGGATTLEKRTHVYIHGCDNTIKYVYGGGNAADAMGVESIIEGGRFNEVYGGGNGLLTPANIGEGSVGFIILGGHVNFLFEGSNKEGHIGGTPYVPILPQGYIDNCEALTVDSYYFGDNEAEHIGDIVNTITCDQASQFNYKYVYAGSRWAVVYGDVKLTVQGGNIRYLFGGSKGYLEDHIPADVRRYPSVRVIDSVNNIHDGYYSTKLRNHVAAHPELVGTGGNVELIINGGTIGEVIGGCDELGTVEGTITVIVDQIDNQACPLFIGNIYGANNLSDCTSIYTDPDGVSTPKVSIIKGTVGGSATFHYDVSNPELAFDGNVFGGGNEGDATGNPKVIVGDGTTGANATPVTIKGDVYGGGNLGDVIGSPKVVVVPERHKLTITPPTDGHGTISVTYTRGDTVASGAEVGEDVDLRIIATPTEATAAGGYLFKKWTVTTAEGASVEARVEDSLSANTLFTMGTGDATLSASFDYVTTKSLTLVSNPSNAGTFKVDGVAHDAGSTMYIPVGATVTVQALHLTGFIFKEWTVTGATLSSTTASVTTFVMTDNVTLTAEFESVYTLTLEPNMTPEAGSFTFKVNGASYTGPISYRANTTVTVQAITTAGYAFLRWVVAGTGSSVGNVNASTTSFTMGTANTTLTAVFAPTHTFTFSAGEHGTVTVTDINGHPVQSGAAIGEGATLNILGTPAGEGYIFDEWTLGSGTGTIGDSHEASTTFVMGNGNVELTGSFTTAPSDPEEPEDPQEP